MTTLLLATVVAIRMAGAPQTFEFQAEAGKAYHLNVTSHCSCYYPQPRVVVPKIEILDASGTRMPLLDATLQANSPGLGEFEIDGNLTFTAPAAGTYVVRISPLPAKGYVGAMPERSTSAMPGGRSKVVTSSDASVTTPVVASQSGRLTLTID
jgi:hypothetical protein